ncbi:MAG: DUF5330 domain-containing protein [Proteobacteria bacterium]|nr:DUF5330 domain-containing protein [Pseudomonadota bacterium]
MLKKTIVLVALIAAMPSPPDDGKTPAAPPMAAANVFAYVTAAADTFADVRGFCLRNPGVCVTANNFAVTVEGKAKYSAKLIYEWANEATGASASEIPPLPSDLAGIDALATGSSPQTKLAESQSTLTLEDLIPEWQAPQG